MDNVGRRNAHIAVCPAGCPPVVHRLSAGCPPVVRRLAAVCLPLFAFRGLPSLFASRCLPLRTQAHPAVQASAPFGIRAVRHLRR